MAFVRALLRAPLVVARSANTIPRLAATLVIAYFLIGGAVTVVEGIRQSDGNRILIGMISVVTFVAIYLFGVGYFGVASRSDSSHSGTAPRRRGDETGQGDAETRVMTDSDWLVVVARSPLVIVRHATSVGRIAAFAVILFFLAAMLLALGNGLLSDGWRALEVVPAVGLFLLLLVAAVGEFAIADERNLKRSRTDR